MKRFIYLAIMFAVSFFTVGQTLIDTTIVLPSIDVHGSRFSGINGGTIKRLHVENNLSSVTNTTAEALRQLPSVVTDIEGGVLFRGSTRTGMLLNGVPYGMLEEYSGDLLIQLPSLFFNNISLDAIPPIQWIPDGDAGIINLSSTQYDKKDFPLVVTLGAGLDERYNTGILLNLHPGRFHITAKYNYRYEFRERIFNKSTTNAGGTTLMNNSASARPDIHLADLSVGYELTRNDLLTVYGLYYRMDYDRLGNINNTRLNPAGELLNKMLRIRDNYQKQDAYAAEARWEHSFENPANRLSVVFNYNNFAYDEDNDFTNVNPNTGAVAAQDNLYIRQSKDSYFLSVGWDKQLGDALTLKSGYTGRLRKEAYSAEANDLKENNWIANQQKSNTFDFERLSNLLFVSIEKKWDNVTGKIGIQAEHSHQKVGDQTNNYLHFYPRLSAEWQTNRWSSLLFSYSQRTIHPYAADLNPFTDVSDATHIRQGNPDLKDEFIHSFDLSYPLFFNQVRITPTAYYRHKTNRIMEVVAKQNDQAIWKKANVGNSNTIGAELSLGWTPVSFLSAGLSGNVFRDEIDGRTIGYDEKKSLVCYDVKGFVSLHLTPTTELQIDGFYISDQLTPQGKIKNRSSVNAGLSQCLLQRKLRANLSINNIFDGLEEITLIDTEAMQMRQVRNRDVRVAWLTLTYSL